MVGGWQAACLCRRIGRPAPARFKRNSSRQRHGGLPMLTPPAPTRHPPGRARSLFFFPSAESGAATTDRHSRSLQVILSPVEGLCDTFRALLPESPPQDFKTVLDLKVPRAPHRHAPAGPEPLPLFRSSAVKSIMSYRNRSEGCSDLRRHEGARFFPERRRGATCVRPWTANRHLGGPAPQ